LAGANPRCLSELPCNHLISKPTEREMSRRKRFLSSLGSGYGSLIANVIYTGASVPLALHYLSATLFGLWAVVAQIGGYLTLLDFGVNSSVARLLVDHKDDLNGGMYGSLLKSAGVVFAAQGLVVLAIGIIGSPMLASLVGVNDSLRPAFSLLMIVQCAVLATAFLTKPFYLTLWSHQRSDVVNYTTIGSLLTNLVILWLGFVSGLGIIAFPLSQLAGLIVNTSVTATMSRSLGLLPRRECWGRVNSQTFREIFSFSRDIFLLGIAAQIISASQVIMVSRFLGLEAAATWSICTKAFQFAQQIVYRIFDFSEAAFSEMVVRREIERFKHRYASIVALTASAAVLFAILGMAANSGLVHFWTGGRISWNFTCDVAAAIFLVVSSVDRTYAYIVILLKDIGVYRFVSLLEAGLVIAGGSLLGPRLGFVGIFIASIVSSILCSGLYGAYRTAKYLRLSLIEITAGWLTRPAAFALVFATVSLISSRPFLSSDIFWIFAVAATVTGAVGVLIFYFVGLQRSLQVELSQLLASVIHRSSVSSS
jgi:O-antigen/teichoic acid export membrane protein